MLIYILFSLSSFPYSLLTLPLSLLLISIHSIPLHPSWFPVFSSPLLLPSPLFFFSKQTEVKVMPSYSPLIPVCDPLVTGASREQGIVGYAMAEQLWWGQGSAVLTTACCPGRGGGAAVARAGFVVLPDGAWRWENWGKGRGEREDIKNEKRKKSTKRGLESKTKAGKMRKRRKWAFLPVIAVFYAEKRRWKQFVKELRQSYCVWKI